MGLSSRKWNARGNFEIHHPPTGARPCSSSLWLAGMDMEWAWHPGWPWKPHVEGGFAFDILNPWVTPGRRAPHWPGYHPALFHEREKNFDCVKPSKFLGLFVQKVVLSLLIQNLLPCIGDPKTCSTAGKVRKLVLEAEKMKIIANYLIKLLSWIFSWAKYVPSQWL